MAVPAAPKGVKAVPNASEAEIEGFAQAQMANQLAFEYRAKPAAFSLLTEGGVASFAFGRFKKIFKKSRQELDSLQGGGKLKEEALKIARKTFMRRVGGVLLVTGAEMTQEFGQEAYNKLLENFASNRAGRPIEPITGVLDAGASGAVGSWSIGPGMALYADVTERRQAGKVVDEVEKVEKIAKAVEEDKKVAEEEGDVLPKGVFPTEEQDVWRKRGFDENGEEVD